jgi:MarR family transcriptional regulator, organic hydroperoxide resistance regulator
MTKEIKKVKPSETSGFLLWRTHNLWQMEIKSKLRPLDLTHVQFILLAGIFSLQKKKEEVTQVKLSNYVEADINMTSAVLRVLEDRKLVKRKQHATDRRANILKLSKIGRELTQEAISVVESFEQDFFNSASPVEFSETLKSIISETEIKRGR